MQLEFERGIKLGKKLLNALSKFSAKNKAEKLLENKSNKKVYDIKNTLLTKHDRKYIDSYIASFSSNAAKFLNSLEEKSEKIEWQNVEYGSLLKTIKNYYKKGRKEENTEGLWGEYKKIRYYTHSFFVNAEIVRGVINDYVETILKSTIDIKKELNFFSNVESKLSINQGVFTPFFQSMYDYGYQALSIASYISLSALRRTLKGDEISMSENIKFITKTAPSLLIKQTKMDKEDDNYKYLNRLVKSNIYDAYTNADSMAFSVSIDEIMKQKYGEGKWFGYDEKTKSRESYGIVFGQKTKKDGEEIVDLSNSYKDYVLNEGNGIIIPLGKSRGGSIYNYTINERRFNKIIPKVLMKENFGFIDKIQSAEKKKRIYDTFFGSFEQMIDRNGNAFELKDVDNNLKTMKEESQLDFSSSFEKKELVFNDEIKKELSSIFNRLFEKSWFSSVIKNGIFESVKKITEQYYYHLINALPEDKREVFSSQDFVNMNGFKLSANVIRNRETRNKLNLDIKYTINEEIIDPNYKKIVENTKVIDETTKNIGLLSNALEHSILN